MRRVPTGLAVILTCAVGAALSGATRAETRTVTNGLEVHETALIVNAEPPTHFISKESCAAAETAGRSTPHR